MPEMTIESAINRIGERTADNKRELQKSRLQRRTEFTDLYGIPHTAQGDANNPATFYISISPDLVYYLRFQFKIDIQPFTSTVSSGTRSAQVSVNSRNLTGRVDGGSVDIQPNPHTHSTDPHTHEVVSGLTMTHTTATDFRVLIHGVDITAYLMEQHGGSWIHGEGLYPSEGTGLTDDDVYDILDVATVMHSEGKAADVTKLLKPGFKKVQITSSAPFQATMYLYLKYNNVGR